MYEKNHSREKADSENVEPDVVDLVDIEESLVWTDIHDASNDVLD